MSSILKRLRDKREGNVAKVRFEVAGQEITFGEGGNVVDGLVRATMKNLGKKFQKKYAHLVHPETGERPDIVISVPDPKKPSVQCRLVTDSEVLRAWLKGQGIVIGEIVATGAESEGLAVAAE